MWGSKLTNVTPPPLLHFWEHICVNVPFVAYSFGQGAAIAPLAVRQTLWLNERTTACMWGHVFTFNERSTHVRVCTRAPVFPFTPVYIDPSASNAYSPSIGQASGTPIRSPIKQQPPHLTRRGQGPCPLTLVCQLGWQHGRGPPPPFPAHQLHWQVQAGKDAPLHPIHAHQHIWWTQAGRGVPGASQRRGQAHFCPGWGLDCPRFPSLSWRVGADMGSQLFPCLTGSHRSPTVIQSCLWPTVDPVWAILDGDLDRHMKATGELGSRELGVGGQGGTGLVGNWKGHRRESRERKYGQHISVRLITDQNFVKRKSTLHFDKQWFSHIFLSNKLSKASQRVRCTRDAKCMVGSLPMIPASFQWTYTMWLALNGTSSLCRWACICPLTWPLT